MMDQLLSELNSSLQDANKWIPEDTMIELYPEPNSNDPEKLCSYDLSTLIGHKRTSFNTIYEESRVSLI